MTGNREYAGHPVVAVGGVVIREGRALLARRSAEPSAGQWSIPGGVLEAGETLREGVARELLEETGLEVEVLGLILVAERIFPEKQGTDSPETGPPRYHYVILDYLCVAKQGEARAGSDAAELAWVSERDLPRFDLHPEALRVVQKAFAMAGKA